MIAPSRATHRDCYHLFLLIVYSPKPPLAAQLTATGYRCSYLSLIFLLSSLTRRSLGFPIRPRCPIRHRPSGPARRHQTMWLPRAPRHPIHPIDPPCELQPRTIMQQVPEATVGCLAFATDRYCSRQCVFLSDANILFHFSSLHPSDLSNPRSW